jgi:type III secretion protein C
MHKKIQSGRLSGPSSASVCSAVRRLASALLAASCFAGLSPAAMAAPIPWQQRDLAVTGKERPLRDYLQDFFAQQGLSVIISENIPKEQVSGTFSPRTFEKLVNGFGLLPYFDGGTVYIYANSEAVSKTLSVDPGLIRNVVRTMVLLEMPEQRRNTFKALEREGIIVLNGARRFVEQAEEVVRSVLTQAIRGPSRFGIYPLKHAWAWDVQLTYAGKQYTIPGVATLLQSLVGQSQAKLEREQRQRPSSPRLRGRGLAGQESEAPATADALNSGPAVAFASASGARIEADRRLNAVIVSDTADRLPFYEDLVRRLDVEPQMIEIEAAIIDVNVDRVQELGINWRLINGRTEVLFGRGNESDTRLRPGQDITPSGRGGFISTTILGDNHTFTARINALAADGDARIVSRPRVLTMSNLEANVENNKTFFVRVQGFQEVDLFNVVSGTAMRVTPSVIKQNGRDTIRLLVNIEDGKLTEDKVDQIPVIEKTSINTQALVFENESMLIGGLVREENRSAVDKIPLLGDIPILGYLFRNATKKQAKTERMFMLSPRIISANRLVQGARDDPFAAGATGDPRAADPRAAEKTAPPPAVPAKPEEPLDNIYGGR